MNKNVIPKGMYCYTYIDESRYVCPYWSLRKGYSSQEDGYCDFLDTGDYELNRSRKYTYVNGIQMTATELGIPFSLLWDQCKECNINMEDEKNA